MTGPTTATSLFTVGGPTVTPTELARGPWDPSACHGGPVAALLARAIERVDAGSAGPGGEAGDTSGNVWQVARLTVELLRPVPLIPLTPAAVVVRPGRKVSLVEADLRTDAGVEVARARALRIRRADVALPASDVGRAGSAPLAATDAPLPDRAHGTVATSAWSADYPAYHNRAVELCFVEGSWAELGPIAAWFRLLVPVVPGEEPTGVQRVAATTDFGNGVSTELSPQEYRFINPDLTIHLLRPPEGIWIGMRTRTHYGDLGAAFAESSLFDERGRVGRSVQSLIIEPV